MLDEIQFNYAYLVEFQPSASGDDEKPFSVLNNAVLLDVFTLFSSC